MMSGIEHLWASWGQPISAVIGGAAGWSGQVMRARMQARRDRLDAGQQALQLVADMRGAEQQLRGTIATYAGEIDVLRQRRWRLDDLVAELHAHAIAARLLVHDLERQLGRNPTAFPPLPVCPVDQSPAAPPGAAEPTVS